MSAPDVACCMAFGPAPSEPSHVIGSTFLLQPVRSWATSYEKADLRSALLRRHIAEIDRLFGSGTFSLMLDDYEGYRSQVDARTRAALELRSRGS